MKVTVWTTRTGQATSRRLAVTALKHLGYRAVLKSLPNAKYFGYVDDSRNRVQIGFWGWGADYTSASNFFTPLFTCASFMPNSQNNQNPSEFCDRHIDKQIKQALAKQTTNPSAANSAWQRIDRQIVDQAPWYRSQTRRPSTCCPSASVTTSTALPSEC